MAGLTRDFLEGNLFDRLDAIERRIDRLERARAADRAETTQREFVLTDKATGKTYRLVVDSAGWPPLWEGAHLPLYLERTEATSGPTFTTQGEGGAQ